MGVFADSVQDDMSGLPVGVVDLDGWWGVEVGRAVAAGLPPPSMAAYAAIAATCLCSWGLR